MKYRVHRFDIIELRVLKGTVARMKFVVQRPFQKAKANKMSRDQSKLEQFLNSLEGEIAAIIPNVTPVPATFVNSLLIVEKVG